MAMLLGLCQVTPSEDTLKLTTESDSGAVAGPVGMRNSKVRLTDKHLPLRFERPHENSTLATADHGLNKTIQPNSV